MNIEMIYILILSLGGTLFALGGTEISTNIKGQKWIRRFMLPCLWGAILFFFGHFDLWRVLVFTAGTSIAFHLPYGSKHSYPVKAFTAVFFVLPSVVFMTFSLWQVIVPIGFLLMFWLSNLPATSNYFVWKIVEFMTGVLIGANLVTIMHLAA